jgi:steroid delta-isomerase-like uncharacterized protein
MTRDETKSLLRRHQDALNRHDVDTVVSLYADDAVIDSPMFDMVRGRDAIRRSFVHLFELFPDYTVSLQDALFIAEGNRAAEFTRVTATQHLALFGLPPTGQRVEYHAARLFTFVRDRIASEHRIYDFRGVLERLEKARVDRELTVASAVQRTLCRTHHASAFAEVAGSSLPCRSIGGDFLEYIDLPSGDLGIAVGDVSGKGPAAALVAAMLQGMFSIVATESAHPQMALSRVNRALCRRGIEPRFATLAYAVLSPDGRLTYSNAGHNPPLLLTAAGIERLTVGGPMLGVFDDAEFPQATLTIGAGDSLVMFSDGVTDAIAPDGGDFGMDRLMTCARAAHASAPADILTRLLDTVRDFCGPVPPVDDVTIAVAALRRGAQSVS